MTETEWLASEDPAAMLRCLTGSAQGHVYIVTDRKLWMWVEACQAHGERNDRAFGDYDLDTESGLRGACRAWTEACQSVLTGRTALLREIVGNPFRQVPKWWVRPYGDDETLPTLEGLHVVTPTVLALAQNAYDERPTRKCKQCGGSGEGYMEYGKVNWPVGGPPAVCPDCCGTGRIEEGTLDPDRLAVLADALEEAGCTDAVILNHLRGDVCEFCEGVLPLCTNCGGTGRLPSGPHVRGCWALDLLLGKE